MQDVRDLLVWQKAHQLTLDTYRLTRNFPPDERFDLTSQLRRSSASIAANLARDVAAAPMPTSRGRAEFDGLRERN
jgi:hypothetical protein